MSTRKKPAKSPHNSRIISAIFSGVLFSLRWTILTGMIIYNMFLLRDILTSSWWQQRLAILTNPSSTQAHTKLAQMYWQAGRKNAAQQEIRLAQDILYSQSRGNILGISVPEQDLTIEFQAETDRLLQSYAYWQSVAEERPDYRDAYVQLAYIAYLLRRDSDVRKYVHKLLTVDPTNTATLDLVNYIEGK